MPGIAVINAALQGFEPKVVFAWHCSLMIQLDHQRENGIPNRKEMALIDQIEDKLDQAIKGADPNKPNALFWAGSPGMAPANYSGASMMPKSPTSIYKSRLLRQTTPSF